MIGNDVVDLKQAAIDSPKNFKGLRWKRFLNKIFTAQEQQFIDNSKDQFKTVWLMWSMKEAAYKIHVQQHGERFFNPKHIKCEFISKAINIVRIEQQFYYTISKITEDYIYTTATSEENKKPISDCFRLENSTSLTQSKVARNILLERFSELKNIPVSALEIIKDKAGVPYIFENRKKRSNSFSITHHGAYCGVALM